MLECAHMFGIQPGHLRWCLIDNTNFRYQVISNQIMYQMTPNESTACWRMKGSISRSSEMNHHLSKALRTNNSNSFGLNTTLFVEVSKLIARSNTTFDCVLHHLHSIVNVRMTTTFTQNTKTGRSAVVKMNP